MLASWNDLDADYVGYLFIIVNNLCTALYLTQVRPSPALGRALPTHADHPLSYAARACPPCFSAAADQEAQRYYGAALLLLAPVRGAVRPHPLTPLQGLRSMSLLYYNSLCALPLALLMAFVFEELPYAITSFPFWHSSVRRPAALPLGAGGPASALLWFVFMLAPAFPPLPLHADVPPRPLHVLLHGRAAHLRRGPLHHLQLAPRHQVRARGAPTHSR